MVGYAGDRIHKHPHRPRTTILLQEDKVRWAQEHPEEVDKILANVRRDVPFGRTEIFRWMTCYGAHVLLEYACLVYESCDVE